MNRAILKFLKRVKGITLRIESNRKTFHYGFVHC